MVAHAANANRSAARRERYHMQIPEFIARKIESAFEELTEKLADELAKEHGEDMPTGALAFEMMSAEMFLQNQWREYCKQKAAEHRG